MKQNASRSLRNLSARFAKHARDFSRDFGDRLIAGITVEELDTFLWWHGGPHQWMEKHWGLSRLVPPKPLTTVSAIGPATGTGSYSGANNPASITMRGPIIELTAFSQNSGRFVIVFSVANALLGLTISAQENMMPMSAPCEEKSRPAKAPRAQADKFSHLVRQ